MSEFLLPEVTPERAAEIVRGAFDLSPAWPGFQRLCAGTRASTRHIDPHEQGAAVAELLTAALVGLQEVN